MATDYDIAIVGGGINGAGIACDAAERGLRVILLEKDDFGWATSAWSSRLIHGGLRYLEYAEIPLVFESLHERERLLELAPHLVRDLCLTIPVYEGSRRGLTLIRLGMIAYDLLSVGKQLPRHRMLDRDEMIARYPGLRTEGLKGGAEYHDAQVAFIERLVLENVIAAKEAGADVRNHSPVIGINVRRGAVHTLEFVDFATGEETEVGARVIINAAGPWVDRVLATVNRQMPRFMGGTRGSHIIVGPFEGAPDSAFYIEAESDGRPFFVIPWNGQYLIGTTDIRHDGDPGEARASREEVDYLLAEANRVFTKVTLTDDDIHYTYAGIRPLPWQEEGPESAITRKHIIHRHRDEARGLLSVIGGKLTTYRSLAEEAVDKAVRHIGCRTGRCHTRTAALPGGAGLDEARRRLQNVNGLSAPCTERLLSIYGSRATRIAAHADKGFLDNAKTVLAAEVSHAVREEFAVTLTDILFRRTMLGLGPDQGAPLIDDIASLAAVELGWDRGEISRQLGQLRDFKRGMQLPRAD
ncbi:MAG: glycerol-3-phosphate dehydrogenase [Gammaproteobacteria bacterium]|nr:glycerol-3-phosphate dehydrogenase [Gammaproteobacteria bacterium]